MAIALGISQKQRPILQESRLSLAEAVARVLVLQAVRKPSLTECTDVGHCFNCFTPLRWVVNGMAMAIAALLGEWLCVRRELQEIPLGECLLPAEELVQVMGSALVPHA